MSLAYYGYAFPSRIRGGLNCHCRAPPGLGSPVLQTPRAALGISLMAEIHWKDGAPTGVLG